MRIRNQGITAMTMVPNTFIDEYMAEANGEFVKVYLYLLRLSQQTAEEVSISALADRLNHTEADILRALRYWEKQRLLVLPEEGREPGELRLLLPEARPGEETPETAGPRLVTENRERQAADEAAAGAQESVPEPETAEAPAAAEAAARRTPVAADCLERLQNNADFRQVLFVAETYLRRTLSPKDIELFAYLYEELKFSADLLEYLVEYCVGGGHRSTRYMESVALHWHQEGKRTVQQAKDAQKAYSRENKQVMRAFGITGRVLTAAERRMVERWLKEYGFPLEVIVEACGVTMSAIHQPSFEYTDKVLEAWRKAGVQTAEEARKYRESRRQSRRGTAVAARRGEAAGASNRFRNYEQRDIDYDDLLRQGSINLYR